ncbi:hypothetical protein U3A55_12015 [Salarchaeum sp. III]|uniref:hypothetical protein n=1 Tax=Salarchaeum sp. III TaxID=3107927 RepID=UPI002ED97C59
MTFNAFAEHEVDGDTRIAVGRNRHGEPLLVLDGPDGVTTNVRFDRATVTDYGIEFRLEPRTGTTYMSASINGPPEEYGAVGEWVLDHDGESVGQRGET